MNNFSRIIIFLLLFSFPVFRAAADIPNEETLYKYAYNETSVRLRTPIIEDYLKNYEGVNLEHTINVLYKYCSFCSYGYPLDDKISEYVKKGIQYTLELNKIYDIPDFVWVDHTSNLYFFRYYAEILESKKMYQEAIKAFELLKALYVYTEGKFNYGDSDSVEELDGKIYALDLLVSDY